MAQLHFVDHGHLQFPCVPGLCQGTESHTEVFTFLSTGIFLKIEDFAQLLGKQKGKQTWNW